MEQVGTVRKMRHIFLFNDVLICARQKLPGRFVVIFNYFVVSEVGAAFYRLYLVYWYSCSNEDGERCDLKVLVVLRKRVQLRLALCHT